MPDDRREVELSTAAVHYRAASGRWREIDTTVGPTDEPGFGFVAENGAFSALFAERGDRLMRVELAQLSLGLGLPDTATPVRPEVSGEPVLFRDVVGCADLPYTAGADAVKEEIVLEHAPESEVFTFD